VRLLEEEVVALAQEEILIREVLRGSVVTTTPTNTNILVAVVVVF
jgi:hypothetical protein